jgi:hypothetical protein
VIVTPERDTPGTGADQQAGAPARLVAVLRCRAHAVHPPQQEPEHHQHRRLERQRPQQRVRRVLEQKSGNRRRHRGDHQLRDHAPRAGLRGLRARHGIAREPDERPAKRGEQREQRAPMQRDVERDAGVRPAKQRRDRVQVGAARDREEFGETLHDAEHGSLERGHDAAR